MKENEGKVKSGKGGIQKAGEFGRPYAYFFDTGIIMIMTIPSRRSFGRPSHPLPLLAPRAPIPTLACGCWCVVLVCDSSCSRAIVGVACSAVSHRSHFAPGDVCAILYYCTYCCVLPRTVPCCEIRSLPSTAVLCVSFSVGTSYALSRRCIDL